MDIALDYYRIFEAVARHRSFTRAAEALVNSQPNLTRAVHNLEAELGCRLFLRSSRGVELTPEGEALYAHVTAAMEQLRAGEAELQRQRELRSGMVSIACSETALHAVLLQVLSRFHRENPAIRLRVSNQSAPEAIDALRSGLAELAVVTMPPAPLSAPWRRRCWPRSVRSPCAARPSRWTAAAPLRSGRSRPCRSSPYGAARARLTSMRACSAAMG